MKRLTLFAAAALATTITFTEAQAQFENGAPTIDENADGIADGRARMHRGGDHRGAQPRGPAGEFVADLTDEQKAELKALRESLRETDATREDAHAALQEKLAEFGVDLPDMDVIQAEREAERVERQAQRDAVRTLVDGLKADGATREEIRAALTEAGFEPPPRGDRGNRGNRGDRGRGHGGRGRGPAPAANDTDGAF